MQFSASSWVTRDRPGAAERLYPVAEAGDSGSFGRIGSADPVITDRQMQVLALDMGANFHHRRARIWLRSSGPRPQRTPAGPKHRGPPPLAGRALDDRIQPPACPLRATAARTTGASITERRVKSAWPKTTPPVHGVGLGANTEPVDKSCAAPRRRSRPIAPPMSPRVGLPSGCAECYATVLAGGVIKYGSSTMHDRALAEILETRPSQTTERLRIIVKRALHS